MPVEVAGATPFPDRRHRHNDAAAAARFWDALLLAGGALRAFRSRFAGKCRPVHYFWGSFDLAVTRFSGRPAPVHPGGAPNLADWATRASYNAALSSAGQLRRGPRAPRHGRVQRRNGRVPAALRSRPHRPRPRAAAPDFCQSTYEAAALARWDRDGLELKQ